MSWLLAICLKNALLALPLAALATVTARWSRRTALAHLLWVLVLVKLLTPPLVDVPVGWRLNVEDWLASAAADTADPGTSAATGSPRQPGPSQVAGNTPAGNQQAAQPISHRRGAETKSTRNNNATTLPSTSEVVASSGARRLRGLALCWFSGSLLMALLLLFRAWWFRRYLRQSAGLDEFLAPRVAELAQRVGLTIAPRVVVVDGVVSPMLFGLGQRACLVFPSQLARRLSQEEVDSLLLHELAHYWRGDHWIRALELAALVVYWWNPLVWIARREIEAAEETCCDAWVVERHQGMRQAYAEALLTTIDFLCGRPPAMPPIACGIGEVELIRQRLTQIVRGEATRQMPHTLHVVLLTAGLIVSALEPALSSTSDPPAVSARQTRVVPATPRSVADGGSTSESSPAFSPETASPAETNLLPAATFRTQPSRAPPAGSPARPVARRPASVRWAEAVSSNGKYVLEARNGWRTTLVTPQIKLDLSAHGIRCVSFAPDGRQFVTGHADSLVRLWDSETGGLEKSFSGSRSEIASVQISPDGSRVAAGARDGSVHVWDLGNGSLVAQLPGQESSAGVCLRWSPRGDLLAIVQGDFRDHENSSLLIWNPEDNAIVVQQILDEPAGALDWVEGDESIVLSGWSGRSIVWTIATGQVVDGWMIEKDRVSAAAWSPDCPLTPQLRINQFSDGAPP
jgi:bla regulator protein blaR1